MYIKDIISNKKPSISFEIFPPKKDMPISTILDTLEALEDLKPDFISVTYGAGGSNSNRTVEIASLIKEKYKVEALAHLTCIVSKEEEIDSILSDLKYKNIENIMALRGDIPKDCTYDKPLKYKYAKDLVEKINREHKFCLGGACYPEGHPECIDIKIDIDNLKSKVDSGVDFLITQFFFDNELFYDFLNKIRKAGINIPVLPGVMPILNTKQIERMVSISGCSIPKKISRIMYKYENNTEALKEAGIAYATEQIIDLISYGADGVHIYTMNKPEPTRKIVKNLSEIRNVLTNSNI